MESGTVFLSSNVYQFTFSASSLTLALGSVFNLIRVVEFPRATISLSVSSKSSTVSIVLSYEIEIRVDKRTDFLKDRRIVGIGQDRKYKKR